jgi:gliding motility-associated-like protein
MDGVHYQDSNAFGGLGSGEFTVYVKDKNGCGISQGSVFLLSYPSFFTPNGDGFNDVWTIKDSYTDPDLTISIFDRYGKLIKIISGVDLSWNGTLNGAMLPSTDYWFVAKRGNGKTVKGHFSLKR